MKEIIVYDNFYRDPDLVRSLALGKDFNLLGNYPGKRTDPFLTGVIKNHISEIVGAEVTHWFDDYCGCFQVVHEGEQTWIHSDHYNDWAGVCYLHPNPPAGSGTAFYSHMGLRRPMVEDGMESIPDPYSRDWIQTDYVENVYNRLVLYRGDLFHQATGYFGKENDLSSQRLFQVFFFNT